MVSAKKPKFAKSRRKGWRKVNIDEVEKYYEEQRLREIVGIPKDQLLFTIEKKGEEIKEDDENPRMAMTSLNQRRKVKTAKDIVKNASMLRKLMPTSKVAPIPRTKSKHQSQVNRRPPEKIPKTVGKFAKKKISLKPYDLWHQNMSRKAIKRIAKKKPPSLLPAVEYPHPGTSANPSLTDHQELLEKANIIEMNKIRQEQHYNRVIKKYSKPKSQQTLEKEWLKEMSAGLSKNEPEDETIKDDQFDAKERPPVFKKVVRAEDRKSKAKRHREIAIKLIQRKREQEKEKNRKEAQIFQLKRLKKEILDKEKFSEELQKKRLKKKNERNFQPHRLGPHKYEEPEIALNLSEELTGRLRTLKTAGNLFEERFKSLQKRNIIEPRKLLLKCFKKNIKYITKRDHRENSNEE